MSDIEFLIRAEIAADLAGDDELVAESRRRMGEAPILPGKATKKRPDEMELLLNDDFDIED